MKVQLDELQKLFADLKVTDFATKTKLTKLLLSNIDAIKDEVETKINTPESNNNKFSLALLKLVDGQKLKFKNSDKNGKEVVAIYQAKDASVKIGRKTFSSLSKAALYAKNELCGYEWRTISGPQNWFIDGQSLKDIFDTMD